MPEANNENDVFRQADAWLKRVKDYRETVSAAIGGVVAPIAAVMGWSEPAVQALVGVLAFLTFVILAVFAFRRDRERVFRQQQIALRQANLDRGDLRTAFRGLAAFERGDRLPGEQRRRQAEVLVKAIRASDFRFGLVVGDSGAGKSSLLRAEVTRLLEANGLSIVLITRPGDLGVVKSTDLLLTLERQLVKDGGSSDATVLIIDQFEELFVRFRSGRDRKQIGEALEALSTPPRRLVCAVRRDFLIDFKDLQPYLSQPISLREAEWVRSFELSEAIDVITECAALDGVTLDPAFAKTLAHDLVNDEIVRPPELQIVCTALRGQLTTRALETRGGAVGILRRHIEDAAELTGDAALAKAVLRCLCDIPTGTKRSAPINATAIAGELPASIDPKARKPDKIGAILEQFEAARLVVGTASTDGNRRSADRVAWSLVHDYVVEPIKLATQELTSQSEEANRLLEHYLREARADRRTVIPPNNLLQIRRHISRQKLRHLDVRWLIRRSFWRAYGRMPAVTVCVFMLTISPILALSTKEKWQTTTFQEAHYEGLSIALSTTPDILYTFRYPVGPDIPGQFDIWNHERLDLLQKNVPRNVHQSSGVLFTSGNSADQLEILDPVTLSVKETYYVPGCNYIVSKILRYNSTVSNIPSRISLNDVCMIWNPYGVLRFELTDETLSIKPTSQTEIRLAFSSSDSLTIIAKDNRTYFYLVDGSSVAFWDLANDGKFSKPAQLLLAKVAMPLYIEQVNNEYGLLKTLSGHGMLIDWSSRSIGFNGRLDRVASTIGSPESGFVFNDRFDSLWLLDTQIKRPLRLGIADNFNLLTSKLFLIGNSNIGEFSYLYNSVRIFDKQSGDIRESIVGIRNISVSFRRKGVLLHLGRGHWIVLDEHANNIGRISGIGE